MTEGLPVWLLIALGLTCRALLPSSELQYRRRRGTQDLCRGTVSSPHFDSPCSKASLTGNYFPNPGARAARRSCLWSPLQAEGRSAGGSPLRARAGPAEGPRRLRASAHRNPLGHLEWRGRDLYLRYSSASFSNSLADSRQGLKLLRSL